MKKNCFIGFLLIILITSITVSACSKDDEKEDPITGGTQGTEAAYFIGTWKQSDVDQVWTFKADGTCVRDFHGNYYYHDEGTWNYVPESKTLITDIDGWIWKIISTSDSQWTGTNVSGTKAFTYSRVK